MAATPFDIAAHGDPYAFDIYTDGHAPKTTGPALPGGPCNYTDQTLPRCGCRRFWSRASLSNGVFQDNLLPNLAEVCMCSHHACFHEDVQPGHTQASAMNAGAAAAPVEQENQRPKTTREPLSPVQLPSFHVPGSLGSSLDFNLLDFHTSASATRMEAAPANPANAEDARPGHHSPMPDTFRSWGDFARSQTGHANGPPPFPAQCLMSPPPPPSTASSSQGAYLRPFAGKGLNTLSGVSALRPDSARRLESDDQGKKSQTAQSLGQATAEAASTPRVSPSQSRSVLSPDGAYQRLADRVDGHEQRLDRLENNSFSVAGHEDCQDKQEHLDLRVTELESRVEEVEKALNDSGSVISGRRTGKHDEGADDATASVVSVSTNATILASSRAEVFSQLQQLQAQVSQLQAAALPSYAKPWELEVVFLPFPLKGIWIEAREFPSQRRSTGSNGDDWTQMPNTVSRATPDPQSPRFQEWPGQGPESNWLLPRAFAAGRVIDQRLKSRGLIKTVLVRGADARSVHLAIHHAFADVLRVSNSDARAGFAPEYALSDFLGLTQPWVPLRKLHKDSRLRFLSPAEMATPALWDFTFLVSSVVMKATGINRLYITQPEAYLQDHPIGYHALETGWTWQKLRELSRVYPDSQSSIGSVPEADALEECWNWNERLDAPASVTPSLASLRHSIHQRASRRSSTEPSQQFYTGVESPILSNGPGRSRAQSPLIQRERKGSWPPHIRTGSLPPVGPAMLSPAQSRRRVSSHTASATPYERRSSPFVSRPSPRPSPRLSTHHHHIPTTSAAAAAAVPKRRFTRSPSLVPRNTPRWSRTSMSRSPSLAPGGLYGYHDERENRERRTTPFYYATPHSEAVPEPHGYHRAGSRGPPAVLRTTGYDPNDDDDQDQDQDMNDDGDFTDTDRGSGTDPYDSEMTGTNDDDGHDHRRRRGERDGHGRHGRGNGSFAFGPDGDDADLDIDVYEDEEDEDELDGVETDAGNGGGGVWHGFGRQRTGLTESFQQRQQAHQPLSLRPEDIPWAGIEDADADADVAAAADGDGDSSMSDSENIDPLSSQQQDRQQEEDVIAIHEDEDGQKDNEHDHDDENDDEEDEEEHAAHRLQRQQRDLSILPEAADCYDQADADDAGSGGDDDNNNSSSSSNSSQAPSEYSSKPGPWQIIPLAAGGDERDDSVAGAGAGGDSEMEGMMGQGQGQRQRPSQSVVMGFRIHEDGSADAGGGRLHAGVGAAAGELLDTQWV